MATPRKHWCRLYDSILRENWDAQTGWTVVRLMAWLNQRWARDGIAHEEAGRALLGPLDIMLVTARRRPDVARTSLERLRDVLGITVERRGDNLWIDWPKFLELQDLGPRSPGRDRTVTAPSETSPVSETSPEEEDPQTPVAPAPAPPAAAGSGAPPLKLEATGSAGKRPRKQRGTTAPESLSQDQRQQLLVWARDREDWAVQHLRDLEEACLGHHRARGNLMVDWYATVQTWVRNQRTRYGGVKPIGPLRAVHGGLADAARNVIADIRARG